MMLFPAVLMNFPNSKVCLIGESSITVITHFLSLSVNVTPCLLTLKLTNTGSCSLFFLPGSIFATAYFKAAGPVRDSTSNEPRYATLHAKQSQH